VGREVNMYIGVYSIRRISTNRRMYEFTYPYVFVMVLIVLP
jgi:hypothetical protein